MKLKTLDTLFAVILIVAAATVAAVGATYTKQNARVARIQMDPQYIGAGASATSVPVSAFLETVLVNDAAPDDVLRSSAPARVDFDLLDPQLANTNITAAGKTVTYPQLAALLRQAALDRANAGQ